MNETTNDLANRLRAWRERERLTLEQAAPQLGVTVSTLWRWETGRRHPRGANDLEKIARVLSASSNAPATAAK